MFYLSGEIKKEKKRKAVSRDERICSTKLARLQDTPKFLLNKNKLKLRCLMALIQLADGTITSIMTAITGKKMASISSVQAVFLKAIE